jgi:hypothetical protein
MVIFKKENFSTNVFCLQARRLPARPPQSRRASIGRSRVGTVAGKRALGDKMRLSTLKEPIGRSL